MKFPAVFRRGRTYNGAKPIAGAPLPTDLERLAAAHGVQTRYRDAAGTLRTASPAALTATLRALGAPLDGESGVAEALRARQAERRRSVIDPVVVAWSGAPAPALLRLPAATTGLVELTVMAEGGETRRWRVETGALRVLAGLELDGERVTVRVLPLPQGMVEGYHRLLVAGAGWDAEARLIVAPPRAWSPPDATGGPAWGVFLPLYALRTGRGWGVGDLSDLGRLALWAGGLGAGAVGTLPLTAAFLDRPFEPSPYAPASRLFWNELFLDVAALPGLATCDAAQAALGRAAFRRAGERLENARLVDYAAAARHKRQVVEPLARAHFAAAPDGGAELRAFLAANPAAADYARFRAAIERRGDSWPSWPAPLRDGELGDGDYAPGPYHYHLYVQWQLRRQLETLARSTAARRVQLYLDLPLGVHHDSFDVWRERNSFALGASGGAPPDALFAGGQDWGFPPLHPERSRATGHRYFIAAVRNYMRHAHILRVDHVMGLHRLYWVPAGFSAREGVYVRYPAPDLYAVLCLESHRNRCRLVGENLGTVPPHVNAALARRNFHPMYVAQFALTGRATAPLEAPPPGSLASMNTHDTPTFAGFTKGTDLAELVDLGLLDGEAASARAAGRRQALAALAAYCRRRGWVPQRRPAPPVLLAGALRLLARSRAALVLINLEDLWGATGPQNVPGTWSERPNWRRRARLSLGEFGTLPQIVATLTTIDRLRRRVSRRAVRP